MSLSDTVISTIRAEMARNRMSQRDIADALSLHQVSIHRRMSGAVSWRIDEVETLASLFNVTPDYLMSSGRRSP